MRPVGLAPHDAAAGDARARPPPQRRVACGRPQMHPSRPLKLHVRTACPAVAAGACLALGACGAGAPSLETKPVAHAIARSILNQHRVVANVHCPPSVPRKSGQRFTCMAAFDVGSYPLFVTETDSGGRVRYANAAPLVLLDIAKVKDAITASILAQRHLKALVICPPEVLQRAGLGFTCSATVASRRYPFVVQQINDSGRVRYEGKRVSGHS